MSNEPENKIDLKDMKLLLDEHYEKAGVPQETGDCKTDYLTALDLLNQGDHMGRWMMERLALRSYRPAMALMTILMAAENGSTGGLTALGQIYEKGGVLAQDLEKAVDCYIQVYKVKPDSVRDTLLGLLREHRVELYGSLRKYPELRALDQELAVQLRQERELAAQEAQEKSESASQMVQERMAQFQRRADRAYQRRYEEELARTAQLSQQAAQAEAQRRQRREEYYQKHQEQIRSTTLEAQKESLRLLQEYLATTGKSFTPEPPPQAEAVPGPRPAVSPAPAEPAAPAFEPEEAPSRQDKLLELTRQLEMLRTQAIGQQDPQAMKTLAQIYGEGNSAVAPDENRSAFWDQCYRLTTGDPQALALMAQKYPAGSDQLSRDYTRVFELCRSMGLTHAARQVAHLLSRAYITGEFGLTPSARRSVYWQKEAGQLKKRR